MLDKYVTRSDKTAFRIIDGEAVIMTLENNTLHALNDVGSRIWELSDGSKTLVEIIEAINSEYEVGYEESKADCISFIEELQDKGMLELTQKSSRIR